MYSWPVNIQGKNLLQTNITEKQHRTVRRNGKRSAIVWVFSPPEILDLYDGLNVKQPVTDA